MTATDLVVCGCCAVAESVGVMIVDGILPTVEVPMLADGLLLLLPIPLSRASTPLASEQNIEPILTGLDPRLADELSVKVGPSVVVPWASLNAWQTTSV